LVEKDPSKNTENSAVGYGLTTTAQKTLKNSTSIYKGIWGISEMATSRRAILGPGSEDEAPKSGWELPDSEESSEIGWPEEAWRDLILENFKKWGVRVFRYRTPPEK
jgi:hypothetical protein